MFLKFHLNWISWFSLSLSLSLSFSQIFQTLERLLSDDTMSDHSGGDPVGHTVSRTVAAHGGSLFGRWVALSKPRASSSHLDSECWTRENLGRRTDTPRIRKASVLTHASRFVCISPISRVRACKWANGCIEDRQGFSNGWTLIWLRKF